MTDIIVVATKAGPVFVGQFFDDVFVGRELTTDDESNAELWEMRKEAIAVLVAEGEAVALKF